MVFFSVAIKVLIFGLVVGVGLAVVFFVFSMIYLAPYSIWLGAQNCKGRYKDQKDIKLSRTMRNATRLYAAWITRREPTF